MSLPPDPPEGYVTVAAACRVLGISDRTLRRRVQAGEIEGEYVARPQGSVLYVRLPQAAEQAAPGSEGAEATRQDAAIVAMLLERLDSKDAALLAATERAASAEAERDILHERIIDLERQRNSYVAWLDEAHAEVERLRKRAERPWWRIW